MIIIILPMILFHWEAYSIDPPEKHKTIDRFTIGLKSGNAYTHWKMLDEQEHSTLEQVFYRRFNKSWGPNVIPTINFRYFMENRGWSISMGLGGKVIGYPDYYFSGYENFIRILDLSEHMLDFSLSIEKNIVLYENSFFSIRNYYSAGVSHLWYLNTGSVKLCANGNYFLEEDNGFSSACINDDVHLIKEFYGEKDRLLGLKIGSGLCFDFITKGVKKHTLSFEVYYTKGARMIFSESIVFKDKPPIRIGTNGTSIDVLLGYQVNLGYLFYNKRFKTRSNKKSNQSIRWYEGD